MTLHYAGTSTEADSKEATWCYISVDLTRHLLLGYDYNKHFIHMLYIMLSFVVARAHILKYTKNEYK